MESGNTCHHLCRRGNNGETPRHRPHDGGKRIQDRVYLFNTKGELSPDCQTNKELVEMMEEVTFHEISPQFTSYTDTGTFVIDGLFGSGLNKPLSGGFAAVEKYINASPAMVVSIDIPSGLMGEENTFNVKQYYPCGRHFQPATS